MKTLRSRFAYRTHCFSIQWRTGSASKKKKYFMFCFTEPEKETKTEKMRVALALILLISLATAFKLEKERPVFEDDVEKQDEANGRDEQTDDEGDNEVIVRFTIGSCDI